jgi:hypothetical protein
MAIEPVQVRTFDEVRRPRNMEITVFSEAGTVEVDVISCPDGDTPVRYGYAFPVASPFGWLQLAGLASKL